MFNKKGILKMNSQVEPSKTTSKDFGNVIAGKGGKTLNSNINKSMEDKEATHFKSEKYEPEHDRYLGSYDMI